MLDSLEGRSIIRVWLRPHPVRGKGSARRFQSVIQTFFQPDMRTQASSIPCAGFDVKGGPDMTDPLPAGPQLRPDNLEYLRKQAKQLLRAARKDDEAALARFILVLGTMPT